MDDKVNILVVDDLPEKILVLQTVLEELGQNLVTARSGEEALKRVLEQEFAVILLDVNMPGMDGLETAALIRRRKKTAHTPIIFITAFADEMHTAQGYSLGAVDYILAPVVPEILRTKVGVFVQLFRMARREQRAAEERVALAREQAARAAAEEANRRASFLAEASKVLAGSLDAESRLGDLLRLSVPFLADAAAVTLVDDQKRPRHTEVARADPGGGPVHGAVAKGPDGLPGWLAEAVAGVLGSGHGEGRAAVALPLEARGRLLGVLALGREPGGRRYSAEELALAEELAARVAAALDNARLYREVREADRQKNEFLAMLAHELRNPLAPICNAVEVLRKLRADEAPIRDVRDVIDRQVQQLVRLVDDLLDVSRITRGKVRLQKERVDLAGVIAQAVETQRWLIDGRRHTLEVRLPAEPVRLEADPVRLAQVIGNLLNNAAKYTPEGGHIGLAVERAHQGPDGPRSPLESSAEPVVIRVRDTGIGIPAELLSSVFDLFTQAERSLDRSQGGLGIGLTLVQRLVEMHGGRVEARSDGPGRGAEFVVTLPAEAGRDDRPEESGGVGVTVNGAKSAGDRAASEPSLPAPMPLRRRVLVIDDHQDAAESLAMVLRLMGHGVRICADGPAGLAAVKDFEPEVVFLDIGLPGMDGYEVARRMRRQAGGEGPLLVALTGYGQDEDVRRSREAGFDHHLVKPADLDALSALLAEPSAVPH